MSALKILLQNGPMAPILADRSLPIDGKKPDDVGLQRGSSNKVDWYSFAGVIVTLRIKNRNKVCNIYQKHDDSINNKIYNETY